MIRVAASDAGGVLLSNPERDFTLALAPTLARQMAGELELLVRQGHGEISLEVSGRRGRQRQQLRLSDAEAASQMVGQLRHFADIAEPWLAEAGHA